MGFQSSFNQLLATISAGALGYEHVKEQTQANKMQALNTATKGIEESEALKSSINYFNKEVKGIQNEQTELNKRGNKLQERMAETKANMEGTKGRTYNAYRQQLGQQEKALASLSQTYESNRALLQSAEERRAFLQGKLDVQKEKNDLVQKDLKKYKIKLGGKQ